MSCYAIPIENITDLVVVEDDEHRGVGPLSIFRHRPCLHHDEKLQQHYPSPAYSCCMTSYAGSVATMALIRSDHEDFDKEDIRSTATTEVVSHQNRVLLATTLASAALRQEEQQQQDAEERAYHHLMGSPPKSTSHR
jgi:hypothetical protein